MPNSNPSPETRFTSTLQPKTLGYKQGRHKGRTATEWLKHLSKQKISFHNPLTGKTDTAPVSHVVAIQLILKATQDSDLASIREFLDRTDGKVTDKMEMSGSLKTELAQALEEAQNRIKNYARPNVTN